jgi:hypothetical protein
MSITVSLSRSDRVYNAGDKLLGEVIITGPVDHSGIRVTASGSVHMRVSERAVGVFEAFFLNVRPLSLLNEVVEARRRSGGGSWRNGARARTSRFR